MRIPSHGNGPGSSEDPRRELDRLIAEAVSPEKMRNNPYRGRPLRLDENPFEGQWSSAYRLVRNAGHRLPWMDLQAEIVQRLRSLSEAVEAHRAWLRARVETLAAHGCTADDKAAVQRAHDRFVTRITEQIADLRKKISDFNLTVPLPHLQIRNIRAEAYLNEIGAGTAALLAALQALPERPAPAAVGAAGDRAGRWVVYGAIAAGLLLLIILLGR